MSAQHTPAPWAISRGFKSFSITSSRRMSSITTWQKPMQGDVSDDEAEANANLLANAPELLWFAQQIFAGLDTGMLRMETPADETLANVLNKGRIAIVKATGAD